jgi:acyl-CoA dehydrogenase
MSEPDSGSDLASVRTRAVRSGDKWVINGRKIWTTCAHQNHYILMLCQFIAWPE